MAIYFNFNIRWNADVLFRSDELTKNLLTNGVGPVAGGAEVIRQFGNFLRQCSCKTEISHENERSLNAGLGVMTFSSITDEDCLILMVYLTYTLTLIPNIGCIVCNELIN